MSKIHSVYVGRLVTKSTDLSYLPRESSTGGKSNTNLMFDSKVPTDFFNIVHYVMLSFVRCYHLTEKVFTVPVMIRYSKTNDILPSCSC